MRKNLLLIATMAALLVLTACGKNEEVVMNNIQEEDAPLEEVVDEGIEEENQEEQEPDQIIEEPEEEIIEPWIPFEYEEKILREDGSVLAGFNVPSVVSDFEIKDNGDSFFIVMNSFINDPYSGKPSIIFLEYSFDGKLNDSWNELKEDSENEYVEYEEEGKKYRKYVKHEESISTELGDFDFYTSKVASQNNSLDVVKKEDYPYAEQAFLEYNGGIIKIFKNSEIGAKDPLVSGSVREFLPIIVNDVSYKVKVEEDLITETADASDLPDSKEVEDDSIDKEKEDESKKSKDQSQEGIINQPVVFNVNASSTVMNATIHANQEMQIRNNCGADLELFIDNVYQGYIANEKVGGMTSNDNKNLIANHQIVDGMHVLVIVTSRIQ